MPEKINLDLCFLIMINRYTTPLITPKKLTESIPADETVRKSVFLNRDEIRAILRGEDNRVLIIVGPCSIHDPDAARIYAQNITEIRSQLPHLKLAMRVYLEKPRTSVGWKGLINDPYLDNSFDIDQGLRSARQLLLDINQLGIPVATEFLEPFTPRYLQDLVSWTAIGARTVESQTHRQMASGLSMPVGFKNPTHGDLFTSIYALKTSREPHHFLDIDDHGRVGVTHTRGNDETHIILRGSQDKTNYDKVNVKEVQSKIEEAGESSKILIDCSHANSNGRAKNQPEVAKVVTDQIVSGNNNILGLMLESNLEFGKQKFTPGETKPSDLKYGISITDECLGWIETEHLLIDINEKLGSI